MNGVIQAIQDPEITLASNTASLPFAVTDLRTRSAMNCGGFVNHNEGSALFSILEGGVYRVSFNANITSATAGQVALALFGDGIQQTGTEMDAVIGTAGEFSNIAFSKDIRVCCKGTVNLAIASVPSIVYSGGATPVVTEIPILKNAKFNIERLS